MLNVKQEKFIQNLVKGMSQREAYKQAYQVNYKDEAIDNNASKLFNKNEVQTRYKELLEKLEDEAIMSAIERRKWLTRVINNQEKEYIYITGEDNLETKVGSRNADLNTKMKAMDMLNKMDAEYVTKVEADVNSDVSINIELSDD